MKYLRISISALAAAVLITAAGLLFLTPRAASTPLDPAMLASQDNEAPDFEFEGIDGRMSRLSDFRGRVVVLNFWATWCPPCRYEIPAFIKLQDEYEQDVQFIGISLDERGWDVVRPFAEEFGINYPLGLDGGRIAPLYGGAEVLPSTFLIDREGRIEVYAPGMVQESDLREILVSMIAAR